MAIPKTDTEALIDKIAERQATPVPVNGDQRDIALVVCLSADERTELVEAARRGLMILDLVAEHLPTALQNKDA